PSSPTGHARWPWCSGCPCRAPGWRYGPLDELGQLLPEPIILEQCIDKPAQVRDVLAAHQHDQVLEVVLGRNGSADWREQVELIARPRGTAGHHRTKVLVASGVSHNAQEPGHRRRSFRR